MRCAKLLILVFCLGLSGCAIRALKFLRPKELPDYEQLSTSYYLTKLKESNSADVLVVIQGSEDELLSQSRSVVASLGRKKKDRRIWFNMVAFDENEFTARRKYFFFVVDERPKFLSISPLRGLVFDSEMVLEREILNEPYANENARRVAMLRQVLNNVRKDVDELAQDNKLLDICGMLINQTLETILRKLDGSPVMASKLSDAEGVEFDHITLGKGSIWMGVTDDIVEVEVELGPLVYEFEDLFILD